MLFNLGQKIRRGLRGLHGFIFQFYFIRVFREIRA